jgi:hypothetical protein
VNCCTLLYNNHHHLLVGMLPFKSNNGYDMTLTGQDQNKTKTDHFS